MDAVHSILAVFSPRKQPQPPPPPPPPLEDPRKPHARSKTYSKKDRIRAKRALNRITNTSDARTERSRHSNASNASGRRDENGSFLSQSAHTDEEGDIYDATPKKKSTRERNGSTPTPKASVRDPDPYAFPSNDDGMDVDPAKEEEEEVEEEEDEEEEEEEHTFTRFLKHRWVGNTIEIQVEWTDGPPTWEPEANLHRDAPQALFAYWKRRGGRPPNPRDPDLYDIFAIRKHSKDRRKLLVEWVGFDQQDMTWLPTRVVRETARSVVDEYWRSKRR